ncbi:TRAP transporter small permease [Radiobacillus kanasensis]|uniref:TRAP transporter small permease n=1 Tax=Radiobacillus kanasensis TaxID=2844358 RepID=UPI001E492F93|nr:TRAP transporter small permease [Radiobacillus kanasensis]UFT98743.1 TRAP transporter small permease [Radiobacillus kanasensis]
MRFLQTILNKFEEITVSIALISAVALSFTEVILRKFFGSSLGFTQELVIYLLIFVGLVGAAMGVRKKVHLGVDVVVKQFSHKWQKTITILSTAACAIFSLLILWLGIQQVQIIKQFGQVTPEMEIPLFIPISIVPIAFALMSIRFIQDLVKVIQTPPEQVLAEEEGAF